MPVGLTTAYSSQANKFISDIETQYLLVDRGYDIDKIIQAGTSRGVEVVPFKKNRKVKESIAKESAKTVINLKIHL